MTEVYFKKRLQSILTDNKYDRFVGGYRTGKIDQRRLPKVAINSSRVFKRRIERKGKRYSVVLVVDISGSMMEFREKMELAAESAARTYDALRQNDVDVAIITFNTVVRLVKDFGVDYPWKDVQAHLYNLAQLSIPEPIDSRAAWDLYRTRGVVSKSPPSENYDYIAIQDAVTLLESKVGEKIMIVYSDGQPQGGSFLRPEINRAIKKGITTLGIGIYSNSVSNYYPHNKVINQMDALYPATITLLSKHIKRG